MKQLFTALCITLLYCSNVFAQKTLDLNPKVICDGNAAIFTVTRPFTGPTAVKTVAY